jgi:hypothetical protein
MALCAIHDGKLIQNLKISKCTEQRNRKGDLIGGGLIPLRGESARNEEHTVDRP